MSQADTRGEGISPHVLQMRERGEAPAGRGRACEGHFCGQVWARGLQGAGDPFAPPLPVPAAGGAPTWADGAAWRGALGCTPG